MATIVPQTRTIDALDEVWSSIATLLAELTPDEWSAPTPCPGWDVRANVAHIIGTEAMLAGEATPSPTDELKNLPHVRNDIGAFNEAWVAELSSADPAALLERFTTLTGRRLGSLRAMPAAEWEAEGFTPAGQDTHGRFMRIRVFDCWMHEQDMRDGVGRPGHTSGLAVEVSLDEMAPSMGYVVGKKAAAADGQSVTFDLTGDSDRQIHVLVDGRAAVVESLPGPATAVLSLPVGIFSRLAGGRIDPTIAADQVTMTGDTDLGQRVIANLNYTI